MMIRDDFVAFILTHGRPDNVITYNTLRKQGYTGKVIFIVDNEDNKIDEYKKLYGDDVVVFDKLKKSKEFDTGDLSEDRRAIVYARNVCFDVAREKGYKYFVELDDDYNLFALRYRENGLFRSKKFDDLDYVFSAFIEFLENTPCLTIAMAQGGDFIGGAKNKQYDKGLLRKCMNSFFCSVDKYFTFVGRINEDVNTYTTLSSQGKLLFTYSKAMLNQKQTQSNKGGMTDIYLDSGTWLKSFFSVMYSPSCVKVALMGDKHKRIHHNVEWEYCAPKILNEKWRKEND